MAKGLIMLQDPLKKVAIDLIREYGPVSFSVVVLFFL